MRASAAALSIVTALGCWSVAAAYPDGAPWGAANIDSDENCSSCHFESDPVRESAAITVEIVDDTGAVEPDSRQVLTLRFVDDAAATAGFQVLSSTGSCDVGRFEATDDDIEAIGAAARSIEPRTINGAVSWTLAWHSPAPADCPITFKIAVTAANDDGSPFGDVVHYREYVLRAVTSRDSNIETD